MEFSMVFLLLLNGPNSLKIKLRKAEPPKNCASNVFCCIRRDLVKEEGMSLFLYMWVLSKHGVSCTCLGRSSAEQMQYEAGRLGT